MSHQRVRVALEELHEPPGAPELVDLASVRLVQCEVLQAVRGALLSTTKNYESFLSLNILGLC